MRTRLAVAVAVVMATAACGGGDGGDGDDTASGTEPAVSTTTTAVAGGAAATTTSAAGPEAARVRELVLRDSDFPAGWSSEPADEEVDQESEAALARCLGVEVAEGRPEATSPDFSVGDSITQVASAAELVPDLATVEAEFAAVAAPKALECVASQFDAKAKQESAGVQFAPARAERLPFPSLGDATAAIRVTTAVAAGGQEVPIFADFVFVRKGLAEMTFSFINAGEPFRTDLAAELAGKVVARG